MSTDYKIPDGNPFKVPENYFDEVKRKIIASTSESEAMETKRGFFIRRRTYLEMAAAVAVLCILTFTAIHLFSSRRETDPTSFSSTEEYSVTILNDVDITALEENVDPDGIPSMGSQAEKEEIINCLLLENFDINDLEDL
jgi:hypothetical protein